jgi:hypothetical protein
MKKKTSRKKYAKTTEIKSLSMHYTKEKSIISVVYKHTEHIKTANPKGKTNTFGDVTNYTLEDRVRVPRLMPLMAEATRKVVDKYVLFSAAEISNHYQQLDWRQVRALKAWRTRRNNLKPVTLVI